MTGKTIHFVQGKRVKACTFSREESVLEVAIRHDVDLAHSCGGMGSCTTCRIFIEHSPEPLPERNEIESDLAQMRGFSDQERLACQLEPLPGLRVRIPETPD